MAQKKQTKRYYKLTTYFNLKGKPQPPFTAVLSDRSEISGMKVIHEATIRYVTENQCTDILHTVKPMFKEGRNKREQRKIDA